MGIHQAVQKQTSPAPPCLIRQHDTYYKHAKQHEDQSWTIMEGDDQVMPSSSSSSLEDSSASHDSSTSSSDVADDDASSTNSSSSSSSSSSISTNNGPLFDLAELMAQLPIKRGLSKYYQGKSQSFTSLSRAMSLEDLAKKETPYRIRRMKACKSYAGGGLDIKATTISKKVSRGSFSSLSCAARKRGSFLGIINNSRPPPIPVQKHF